MGDVLSSVERESKFQEYFQNFSSIDCPFDFGEETAIDSWLVGRYGLTTIVALKDTVHWSRNALSLHIAETFKIGEAAAQKIISLSRESPSDEKDFNGSVVSPG